MRDLTQFPLKNSELARLTQLSSEGSPSQLALYLQEKGLPASVAGNKLIKDAAKHGNTEVVRFLLTQPDVDPADSANAAVLNAIEFNRFDTLDVLIKDSRVDISGHIMKALRKLGGTEGAQLLRVLTSVPYVNFTSGNNVAIRVASEEGRTEVVKELLKNPSINPGDMNDYAIRWASYRGHTGVVNLLIADQRVNPTAVDNFAIKWAIYREHYGVAEILLKDPRVRFDPFVTLRVT